MKKFKLFAVALVALTLFSCSKEENGTGNSGETPIGEPTYATFAFNTGGSTRAGSTVETDGGATSPDDVAAEKVIKTVRLLIFNDGGANLLETNKAVTLDGNMKFTELVKSGQKKMFIIANENSTMTTALDALDNTKSLADFLALKYDAGTPGDAAFTLKPLYTKTNDMGFPMSSSNSRSYTFIANVTQAQAEADGATETANAFNIGLDFMLAKVAVVLKDGNVANTAAADYSDITYSIRNIAKETFYTQQFNGAGIVAGPHYTVAANWGSYFDQQAEPTQSVTEAPIAAGTPFVYAAENTKSNSTLLKGGTTYALIKSTIAPKSAYIGDETMRFDPINNEVVLGNVKPIVAGNDFVVSKVAKGKIKTGDVFENVAALEKAYGLYSAGTPVADTDYTTYTDGVGYFQIYVGNTTDAYGQKYGVKRGMQYTATINSIGGFGHNTPDIAPDEPVEQNTYINVSISAKGWTAGSSSTDL